MSAERKRKPSTDQFEFKAFTIRQDRCAMKVGIDAVLLGAWCPLPTNNDVKVLDIGAGTGILSLLLAQRMPKASVIAIEIDTDAAAQAKENCLASPYHDRIEVKAGEIQNLIEADQSFDLIICNPPFFTGGVLSEQLDRNAARHTVKLSHADLLRSVRKFLAPQGSFNLILPKIEALRFQELATKAGLHLQSAFKLRPRADKPVHRILQSFGWEKVVDVKTSEVIQYANGQEWTDDFWAVVGPYYR